MGTIYIHSFSIYGGRYLPTSVFAKLNSEGVLHQIEGQWFFKPLKQAIQQRINRKIFR